MAKQRLRMKDLVTEVFLYLSKKYEQSNEQTITSLITPLEEIREHLKSKYSISYTSNQHIYNQLRNYEEELGATLFRKIKSDKDGDFFSIALEENLYRFKQKQLLYISQKIQIANAVYEKILHESGGETFSPLKILLGAGTEAYYVAKALVSGLKKDRMDFQIYTHNLGIINYLMEDAAELKGIELFTRNCSVDKINNILIPTGKDHYKSVNFDYIIQSSTHIWEKKLFVDSPWEISQKREILQESQGQKNLILTKHEFTEQVQNLESYGTLDQYDYVIVPFSHRSSGKDNPHFHALDQLIGTAIEPDITHYNYRVFRVLK